MSVPHLARRPMPTLAAPFDRSTLMPVAEGPLTSDTALVRRCRHGDDRAFELIYERHHGALYRYCRSFMGTHEDAEEALQTVMMKAYRALRTAERDVALKPWLFRIAHNECVRALQGRRRHAELSGDEEAVGGGSQERAEVRADLDQLRRDLAALPQEQRSALLLREMCGLSHREIGESLGAGPEAVKQLIYEARQALHEFGEGRALACAEVRARVSEGDGRVLRGRRMRAHLRTCPGCQAFRERLVTRPAQLAAIFPAMPAVAARWVLQSVMGGAGGAGGPTVMLGAGVGGGGLKAAAVAALALVAGGAATLPSAPSGAAPARTSPHAAAPASIGPIAPLADAQGVVRLPGPAGPASAIAPVPGGPAVASPVGAPSPQPSAEQTAEQAPGASALVPVSSAASGPAPAQPSSAPAAAPRATAPLRSQAGSGGTPAPTAPHSSAPAVQAPQATTPTVPAVPTLPAVTVPSLPVPTAPSVSTPQVTTPTIVTPPVTTPAVTVPGVVTVPSVTVPSVTVPTVTVPQVTTPPPTVPQPPQLPQLPSLPGAGSG